MISKKNIHGVLIDNVTPAQAIDIILDFAKTDKPHRVFTPNSEIIMQAQRDEDLKRILNSADLLVADGAGVILASRIMKKPIVEKVSGVDLVKSLLAQKNTPLSFYLLGGEPEVAKKAAVNILSLYPHADIKGVRHGYFNDNETEEIIRDINRHSPDILLVCLGVPKQELWIYENSERIKARVLMGVGGTVDILAGKVKLAPEFMRKAGLEWLYRLACEPKRFIRMLDLPRFILLSLKKR